MTDPVTQLLAGLAVSAAVMLAFVMGVGTGLMLAFQFIEWSRHRG